MHRNVSRRTKKRVRRQFESFGRSVLNLAVTTDVGLSQETILREASRHGIVVQDDSDPIDQGGRYDH